MSSLDISLDSQETQQQMPKVKPKSKTAKVKISSKDIRMRKKAIMPEDEPDSPRSPPSPKKSKPIRQKKITEQMPNPQQQIDELRQYIYEMQADMNKQIKKKIKKHQDAQVVKQPMIAPPAQPQQQTTKPPIYPVQQAKPKQRDFSADHLQYLQQLM